MLLMLLESGKTIYTILVFSESNLTAKNQWPIIMTRHLVKAIRPVFRLLCQPMPYLRAKHGCVFLVT
jgi:hypothetical protein